MSITSRSLTRRYVLSAIAGASALAVARTPADAARVWCRTDPVFKIDGQVVDVWVVSDVAMRSAASGPTTIALTVPANSTAECIAMDRGFGYGYAISIERSSSLMRTPDSTPVVVSVRVPSADGALPVGIDLISRSPGGVTGGSASGLANGWVVLATG